MDRKQERDILETLKAQAKGRHALLERWRAARNAGQESTAKAIEQQLVAVKAAMCTGYERLYGEYGRQVQLQARHCARSAEDAEEVSQEAWRRFDSALPNFDAEKPPLPLLSKCVRNASIDYYRTSSRRHELAAGDETIQIVMDSNAARSLVQPRPTDTMIRSEFYVVLLSAAMGPNAGPAHERLTFGFNRLMDTPPRTVVEDHKASTLAVMTSKLMKGYTDESGLPPKAVAGAFKPLLGDMPRRLQDVDRATAERYSDTPLPKLALGAGTYECYLRANAERAVGYWTDNVNRRLREMPRLAVAYRTISGGQA